MNGMKMFAMVLIVAGVLGLLYGGFTYTKHSHDLQLGDLDLSVKSHETVNIPVWVGVGAVAAGTVMLFMRQRTV
jgi:multidrug transporter EmrE-like cation transporter